MASLRCPARPLVCSPVRSPARSPARSLPPPLRAFDLPLTPRASSVGLAACLAHHPVPLCRCAWWCWDKARLIFATKSPNNSLYPPKHAHSPSAGIMAGAWPLQVSALEIPFSREDNHLDSLFPRADLVCVAYATSPRPSYRGWVSPGLGLTGAGHRRRPLPLYRVAHSLAHPVWLLFRFHRRSKNRAGLTIDWPALSPLPQHLTTTAPALLRRVPTRGPRPIATLPPPCCAYARSTKYKAYRL